jgi:LPPG:FO 2-phospho-L-lactate transferase
MTRVTALAGGVGGAKLLVGLARATSPEHLTVIVNTGDDAEIYGVHVSPDVDIVTYWLAGIADTDKGWGIRGDSFEAVDAMGRLGADAWFRLGDRDMGTCMYRTARLEEGATLTEVTDEVRRALGVGTHILPMSDAPVRTEVVTDDGRVLDFQEYFVKEKTEPPVAEIRTVAPEGRAPGTGVIHAIADADVVVICPSNPLLSIDPILSLDGVRAALQAHPRVVAVTPIVRGGAIKGPADRLLLRLAGEASAAAVARHYGEMVDLFVVDASDEAEVSKVEAAGIRCTSRDTIMRDHDASERLARTLLAS